MWVLILKLSKSFHNENGLLFFSSRKLAFEFNVIDMCVDVSSFLPIGWPKLDKRHLAIIAGS